MTVMVEFSMRPEGKGESAADYVARCIAVVEEYGLPYRVNPMGTVIEGSWKQCFEAIEACYDNLRTDCPRISVRIAVDARETGGARMEEKIQSVEKRLGRVLHH